MLYVVSSWSSSKTPLVPELMSAVVGSVIGCDAGQNLIAMYGVIIHGMFCSMIRSWVILCCRMESIVRPYGESRPQKVPPNLLVNQSFRNLHVSAFVTFVSLVRDYRAGSVLPRESAGEIPPQGFLDSLAPIPRSSTKCIIISLWVLGQFWTIVQNNIRRWLVFGAKGPFDPDRHVCRVYLK